MGRVIKFRAWDKYSKRGMIYPNNGDFIGWHAPSNWKDCYDVMQFTGLLDKNGKEIYEGDIIKQWFMEERTVEWRGTSFIIDDKENGVHNLSDYDMNDIQVIGNIYETPNKGGDDE